MNISSNILGNIEHSAFQELRSLRTLDLSMNQLKDLSLKLPQNIEYISLAQNQLRYWPIEKMSKNIQILELQENELMEIDISKDMIEFAFLKVLNVSRNRITSLPPLLYPVLEIFDASYNEFSEVPKYLGRQAPLLKELRLRGNLIKTIDFSTKMSAHILDFSELPRLTEIDANVFNLLGTYFVSLKQKKSLFWMGVFLFSYTVA